jgi:hypothetical protein
MSDENTPSRGLTADQIAEQVLDVENLIGGHSREDVLCILLTVTVNAIHVVEITEERRDIEDQYIKALRFLSAVEEQFQPIDEGSPPDWVKECTGKMMRHVFRAIGAGYQIPE